MNSSIRIIGPAIPGAIIAGLVWFYVNRFVPHAGPGVLERQFWPLNNLYACIAMGAILAAGSGIIAELRGNRRRQAMEAVAALQGLRFRATVTRNDLDVTGKLDVLDNWSKGSNYCVGSLDQATVQIVDVRTVRTQREVNSGDPTVGNRNSTVTENQTVFLLPAGKDPFPSFSIRRVRYSAWAREMFGLQGLEFQAESSVLSEQDKQLLDQFHRDYLLTQRSTPSSRTSPQGNSEESQSFDRMERMMSWSFLKQLAQSSEWNLEFCPSHVAFWKTKNLVRPGELVQTLRDIFTLYQLLLEDDDRRSSVKLKLAGSGTLQMNTSVTNLAPLAIGGCAGMLLAMGLFIPLFFLFAEKQPWIVFAWPVFGMGTIVVSALVSSRIARNLKK